MADDLDAALKVLDVAVKVEREVRLVRERRAARRVVGFILLVSLVTAFSSAWALWGFAVSLFVLSTLLVLATVVILWG